MALSLRKRAESDKRYSSMTSSGVYGPHDLTKVYVDSMQLSTRSRNILDNLNIHSLAELAQTNQRSIELALYSGEKTVSEIKREMRRAGLILRESKIEKPKLTRENTQLAIDYPLGNIYDKVRNVFGPHDFSKVMIYELRLKRFSEAVLEKKGIIFLSDILESNEEDLVKRRAVDRKIVLEAKEAIEKLGLSFRKKSENKTYKLMRKKDYNGPFDLNYVPLIEMGFEQRTYRVLKSLKMYSLADLVISDENKVLFGKNCGKKTLEKIKEKLAELGFSLRGEK